MKRLMVVVLLISVVLAGCERPTFSSEDGAEGLQLVPTPTLDSEENSGFRLPIFGDDSEEGSGSEPLEGRFFNLRFATRGDGPPQQDFPHGTQEIYAIWDYDGMRPDDVIERRWYHDDELYLERREEWDFLKYGFSGTVRDVYHYNYEDGSVFPGQWRVELYLNDELQVQARFTIAAP